MIVLDANFLIGALRPGTALNRQLRAWVAAGENVGINTMAWADFLCGPLSDEDAAAPPKNFSQNTDFALALSAPRPY